MPFQKGNKLGGNKKQNHTLQAEALKKYLIAEIIKEKAPLIKALIEKGKAGDVGALRDILDRILGKAQNNLDITSGGKSMAEILDELDGRSKIGR